MTHLQSGSGFSVDSDAEDDPTWPICYDLDDGRDGGDQRNLDSGAEHPRTLANKIYASSNQNPNIERRQRRG